MNITLSLSSGQQLIVDYQMLADWLSIFDDSPASSDFYNALALHPTGRMRSAVAEKTCLSAAVLEKLAHDPSIEVVKQVACNPAALQSLTTDTFFHMMQRDMSIRRLLLSHRASMPPEVASKISQASSGHEDAEARTKFHNNAADILQTLDIRFNNQRPLDPIQIDNMLDLVRQVWMRNPYWRLGQLVVNAAHPHDPCPEIFYIEDAKLQKGLQTFIE